MEGHYKVYLTQEALGGLIDLDQSNISRLHKKLLPLIEQAADPQLATYLSEAKTKLKGMSVETRRLALIAFYQDNPDLEEAYTDATEQQVFRSQDNKEQEKYYSGKTKQHSLKVQISVAPSGRILDVSKSYPGSVHDKTIFDKEKTVYKFPNETCHRLDAGYQGAVTDYPEHHIILPYKKKKTIALTPLAKDLNRENSKRRVKAEHAFCKVKKFKILSHQYRGDSDDHNTIFRAVAAVENFKAVTK